MANLSKEERAKFGLLTDEQLDGLEASNGPCFVVHLKGHRKMTAAPDDPVAPIELVFRLATPQEWSQAKALNGKADTAPLVNARIAKTTNVHPGGDAFAALVARFPGIPDSCAEAINNHNAPQAIESGNG